MTAISQPTRAAARSPKRRRGLSDRALGTLMLVPALLLLLVFAVYPFLASVFDSFFHVDFLTRDHTFLGLDNYRRLWEDPAVRGAFGRSVLWVAGNMVVQAAAGVAVALLLNAGLRGQTLARGLVLFPYVVPAVVAAMVFRFAFNDTSGMAGYLLRTLGLSDTLVNPFADPATVMFALVAVNCWKYVPFIVIVVLARLQTLPGELREAAALDGAGRFGVFRYVTLPWIAPALIVAMLMRTIWTAYDFDLPYLLSGGGPMDTSTTIPLEIRKLAFADQDLGLASALAVCVAILLVAGARLYLRAYRASEDATG
ncbi:carbohydrate ABC transporter permease [Streptomyces botrytidirepellens]|uniref:Sugar ABC transporter permease n=1 Tax=Streptomyces botrytidirepellens TaxID=2486417 RepID=A0A3M8VW76_9ACTN|nr:sugar ABC transporter permease [Streptomyces botrytidirepellens]RNG20681.1 sugar ABC transporter permease [Streptomyces botrytidirepellens]